MWIKIKTKEDFHYSDVTSFNSDEEDITFVFRNTVNVLRIADIEYIFMYGKTLHAPFTKEQLEKFLDLQIFGIAFVKPMDASEAIDSLIRNRPANLCDFRLPDASRGPDTYFANRDTAHVSNRCVNNVCDVH